MAIFITARARTLASRALARPRPIPLQDAFNPAARTADCRKDAIGPRGGYIGYTPVTDRVTGIIQQKHRLAPRLQGYRRMPHVTRMRARARKSVCCNPVTCNRHVYVYDYAYKFQLQRGYIAAEDVTGQLRPAPKWQLNNGVRP